MGDYNAHNPLIAPTYNHNIHGRQLYQSLTNNQLLVLNDLDQPTRYHLGTLRNIHPSFLDFAIVNESASSYITDCYVGSDIGSDHLPLHITFKEGTKSQEPVKLIRNLKKADWPLFQNEVLEGLSVFPSMEIQNEVEMDLYIELVNNAIVDAFDKACPEKPYKPQAFNISEDTLKVIKLKRKVRRLLAKNPFCPILKTTLKTLTTRVKNAIKLEKQQKWHALTANLDYRQGSEFWKAFKRLTGGGKGHQTTPILTKVDGTKTSTQQEAADLFANHLAKVHNTHQGPIFDEKHKRKVDRTINNNKHLFVPKFNINPDEVVNDHPLSMPISWCTLKVTLSKCKNSAPGEDKIGYTVLKHLPDPAVKFITDLFNYLISIGYFPKPWKNALGVMIPKPNKDTKIPSNYRPISLLRCLGKLLEKSLANPLIDHLTLNGHMNKWQRAYLPQMEANEHIYRLFHHMKTATHFGWKGAAIFLDVEKAFDSVWHNGLKYKLLSYDLPDKIIRILSSFLHDRTIKVRVKDTISHEVHLAAGTPQGSVLSPILFNMYVNDIPFPNTGPVHISQYADDLALWTVNRGKRPYTKIQSHLRKSLYQLEQWCSKWRIKINASKSQLVLFPNNLNKSPPTFALFDTPILPCKEAKILGLLLNPSLSLLNHCILKKQTAVNRLNLLRCLRGTDWGTNIPTLLHLYKTFIRPILETGYVATAAASEPAKNHLAIAEAKALRIALKQFYTPGQRRTTNQALYTMANLEHITSRIDTLKRKALDRYKDSPLLVDLYNANRAIRALPYPVSYPHSHYPTT